MGGTVNLRPTSLGFIREIVREELERNNTIAHGSSDILTPTSEQLRELGLKNLADETREKIAASFSPVAEPHTFEWALVQMKAGKKITRPGVDWWMYIQTELGDHQGFFVVTDKLGMTVFAGIDQHVLKQNDWQLHEG